MGGDDAGNTVDQRRPPMDGVSGVSRCLFGDGLGAADFAPASPHGTEVGANDDVGVEHSLQRFEVAGSGRRRRRRRLRPAVE